MKLDVTILIKGAGEMASGVAWRLRQSHLPVVLTEVPEPRAVRRAVSFSEALYEGSQTVEGVEAVVVDTPAQVTPVWEQGKIPLLVDPELKCLQELRPQVLVEATLSKRYTGITLADAPLVVALGPGFIAGEHAHMVVETNRGHNLGRIYTQGEAEPNTGIPGTIAGKTWERVMRAPCQGVFETSARLGQVVEAGQEVAQVDGQPVMVQTGGVLRGLLRSGLLVKQGQKLGDVDPRGQESYLHTISEKARAIGGSVLEAIMRVYNR